MGEVAMGEVPIGEVGEAVYGSSNILGLTEVSILCGLGGKVETINCSFNATCFQRDE